MHRPPGPVRPPRLPGGVVRIGKIRNRPFLILPIRDMPPAAGRAPARAACRRGVVAQAPPAMHTRGVDLGDLGGAAVAQTYAKLSERHGSVAPAARGAAEWLLQDGNGRPVRSARRVKESDRRRRRGPEAPIARRARRAPVDRRSERTRGARANGGSERAGRELNDVARGTSHIGSAATRRPAGGREVHRGGRY